MVEQTPSSLMYEIGASKEELESRCASLLGVRRTAFQELLLRSPRFSPPELAFYQVVTWLYGFYYEAGRVSLQFLLHLLPTYGLEYEGKHRRHYQEVQRLRTFLQHNLNLDSRHDLETQRICEDWFSESCGSVMPGSGCEWNRCVARILMESGEFLVAVVNCVRVVEKDESSSSIVAQWSSRLSRFHPIHEFEALVAIVINDMGQSSLDAHRITVRHYDKWSQDLQLRSDDYVFEIEARRLIEQTLLNEGELPLLITGQDVIRELGISPGVEVGRLLAKARALYFASPSNKEQLLERLIESENDRLS